MHRATITVTAGRPAPDADAPMNEPVHFASALAAGGDIEYTRHDAHNSRAFEAVLGALEGGHAVLFASGMAAISAVLDVHHPGSVATSPVIYSGTRAALTARRLPHVALDDHEAGLRWVETPTNPDLRITDISSVANLPGLCVVDNTFATPIGQRPLEHGADIVVHSVSKYLSGHSDLILGAVVCAEEDEAEHLREHRRVYGAIPGPMEAWLALRGLRTLDVRFRRAADNARILAERLVEHPRVGGVVWPGLPSHPDHGIAMRQLDLVGPIIGLIPREGVAAADALCATTRLWTHATSLGGVESTLERRRRHRYESDLVDPALVRLSVGIEDVEDLWTDLDQALSTT